MTTRKAPVVFLLTLAGALSAPAQPTPVAELDVGAYLNGARFDTAGEQIMTFESGRLIFRDPVTGLQVDAAPDLGGSAYPSYFAESPDGTLWAQWVNLGVYPWWRKLVLIDAATRNVVAEFDEYGYGPCAFSPDNSEIASAFSGSESNIYVRSSSDGSLSRTISIPEIRLRDLKLAPGGAQWLVAGSINGTSGSPLFLIDRATEARTFPDPDSSAADITYCDYIAVSPDGTKVLANGGPSSCLLWDLSSNALTTKYASDTPDLFGSLTPAWSEDGLKVAVSYQVSRNPGIAEVRIFDAATEATLHTFTFKGQFAAVSFFTEPATGLERLMVNVEGALYLIDPATGSIVLEKEDFGVYHDDYAFSPDSDKYAAIGHDRIDLLVVSGNFTARGDLGSASTRPVAFPDNESLLTAEPDGSIRRISLTDGSTLESFPVHGQQARRLLVDKTNNRVLSYAPRDSDQPGSVDETFLWNLEDGSITGDWNFSNHRLSTFAYANTALSPGETYVLDGNSLYSVDTGEKRLSVATNYSGNAAVGFGKTGNLTDFSSIPETAPLPVSTYPPDPGLQTELDLPRARVTPDGLVLVVPFEVYEEVEVYGTPQPKTTYGLSFWDTATGDLMTYHYPFTNNFRISPDGGYLASGTRVWSMADLLASGGPQP